MVWGSNGELTLSPTGTPGVRERSIGFGPSNDDLRNDSSALSAGSSTKAAGGGDKSRVVATTNEVGELELTQLRPSLPCSLLPSRVRTFVVPQRLTSPLEAVWVVVALSLVAVCRFRLLYLELVHA